MVYFDDDQEDDDNDVRAKQLSHVANHVSEPDNQQPCQHL